METVRTIVCNRMGSAIVISILLGSALGFFLVQEKMVVLNFYYVPVLIAGYLLGKKHAVRAAEKLARHAGTQFDPEMAHAFEPIAGERTEKI